MVRYVGSDKQGGANQSVRGPDFNARALQGDNPLIQNAFNQQAQLGESLKNSYQFQASTAARMSEDFSRTNQSLAQSSSQVIESSGRDRGFSQAMNNLARVGGMIGDTLERRSQTEARLKEQEQKNYEAQMKATREQNASVMWERMSKWETTAAVTAKLEPGGTTTLRNQLDDMFNSVEGGDLTPEDREKLMRHGYGNVVSGLIKEHTTEYMAQQRKLHETNTNTAVQRALIEGGSLIQSVAAARNPQEQQVALAKLSEFQALIAADNSLDPQRKAEINFGLATAIKSAYYTSEENRQKLQTQNENFERFQQDVADARAKYPNDPEAQEAYIAISAERNGIPASTVTYFKEGDSVQRSIQRQEREDKLLTQRQERISREIGAAGSQDEAGYDAELYNGDWARLASDLGGGNVELGKKTARYQQIVAAGEALKKWRERLPKLNQELGALDKEKLLLARGDNEQVLSYLSKLKPDGADTRALLMQMNAIKDASNNPALAAYIPVLTQYLNADAAQRQQYQAQVASGYSNALGISEALSANVDVRAAALRQEKEVLDREIIGYGFNLYGTMDKARSEAIAKRRKEQEAQRRAQFEQEQQERYQQSGGTADTAPFSRGSYDGIRQLHISHSPSGELILPVTRSTLAKQAPPNINSPVGPRGGREHNGQDIGVDSKTPLVAHMDGIVRRVEYQEQGGGHWLEVEYPDGSQHVFMHLYQRPNLVVGQRVKGGQVIAIQGNTGLAGGNANTGNTHIHWEVWYGDKRSTPQQWSAKFRQDSKQRPQVQTRAPGPGSSVTAPVRGAKGVPLKGGMLVPNGSGGGQVVGYNQQPFTPQSLKEAGIVPTPTRVDKTKAGQVLLQRTGTRDAKTGLEHMVATVYNSQGQVVGEYVTNSGDPSTQRMFGTSDVFTANINAPLPTGQYNIGVSEQAYDIPGMRSQFIPIKSGTQGDRSLLGIHFDGDRSVKPGSAGCVVFVNKAEFDQFTRQLASNDIRTLNYIPGLRDTGTQKVRPSYPSKSEVQVGGGEVLYGPGGQAYQRIAGKLVPVQTYNQSRPVRNLTNSNRAIDYSYNANANHGFKALKDNPRSARAVNEVAKSLGVPGEWLAEVISIETDNTFNPAIREYGGSGATGLIQFYPDHEGGSTKTINGRVYNLSDIGRMTLDQQLRGPVVEYVKEAMSANGMKRITSIQDLYGLIYAYAPASKARNMGDAHGNSGASILNRLGKFSGRKYSSANPRTPSTMPVADAYSSDRTDRLQKRIDRTHTASCSTCNQMASLGMFVPHERYSLNDVSTFTIA